MYAMNELSVIGSLRLRKEFWDRHRANIVTCYRGKFDVLKNNFWEIKAFFATVLLYMDKDMLIRGKSEFLLELPQNMS